MAEFLIMAKKHWAEDVDKTGWSQAEIDKMAKQYRIGDIVEVRENGYWSSAHGWDKTSFALLKVSSLSVDDAKYLMSPNYDASDNYKNKRKYQIKTSSISISPGDEKTVNATALNAAILTKS